MTESYGWQIVPAWTNQDIVLYHGTSLPQANDIVSDQVKLYFGNRAADFGRGFYTTTNLSQARRHSAKRSKYRGLGSAVVQITLPREELAYLHGLAFVLGEASATDFWSLIEFCRTGMSGHARHAAKFYDVVYGPVTSNYRERLLHRGFDQVSFHTERALETLNQPGRRRII
jgi:hypothetical protein